MLDLYRPGGSVLHRMGAGVKLLALCAGGTAMFLTASLPVIALALAAIAALYPLAGFGGRIAAGQLRPVWWVFPLIVGSQALFGSAVFGAVLALRLAALLLLAGLVTLTTRSSEMIGAIARIARVFKPLGVDPEKLALTLSLTLRFIPVLSQATTEVREAQRARGLERSVIATAIPVTVRTLKMADEIAEAIEARGFGG